MASHNMVQSSGFCQLCVCARVCVCVSGMDWSNVCVVLQDQYLQEGVEWEAVEVECNHSLLQALQEVSEAEPRLAL